MPAKNKQKNNKRSSANNNNNKAANAKPRSRGVLIQRDIPFFEQESPFADNMQNREILAAQLQLIISQGEPLQFQPPGPLPPRGVWREFKFSTYSAQETGAKDTEILAVVSKIQDLESRYCEACRAKDWGNLSETAVELVQLTATFGGGENHWHYAQYRYDKLLFLDSQFPEYINGAWLLPSTANSLSDMVADEEEDPFFRAYAAHLYARDVYYYNRSYQEMAHDVEAIWKSKELLLRNILTFEKYSKDVTSLDKSRILQRYEKNVSVGNILTQITEAWQEKVEELKKYISVQPEVYEEINKLAQKMRQTKVAEVFPVPPTLDRKTLESVARLPECEKCYLVAKLEFSVYEQYNLGKDCDEGSAKRMKKSEKYAVFQVNRERFDKGKRRGVFDLVHCCLVAKGDPLPKKILSPLVAACLRPHQMIVPGHNNRNSNNKPARPAKVLLQGAEEASQPQVRLFMSMMGLMDAAIEVADPKLMELLAETEDMIAAPSKKEFPHLHDKARGIKCDGCERVGPSLRKCICMKVYYCSRQCQTTEWSAHKVDHEEEMKIKASQK